MKGGAVYKKGAKFWDKKKDIAKKNTLLISFFLRLIFKVRYTETLFRQVLKGETVIHRNGKLRKILGKIGPKIDQIAKTQARNDPLRKRQESKKARKSKILL